MDQTQLHRVQVMEQALREGSAAIEALEAALRRYEAALPQLRALERYYESPLWMQDHDDDDAGKFPPDLPRGVLTEDALYDLLCDHDRLRAAMKALEADREAHGLL